MAYKYAQGKVYRGDIYNEDDTQRNTFIDFSEDAVGIIVGNTEGLIVSGSGAVSSSLNVSASGFYGDGSGLSGITATASPAGSDGQIQYNNGGSTGGATFYWDDSNSNVGIGAAPSPNFAIDVPTSASILRMGRLEMGAWPQSTGYGFLGHSNQDHHGTGRHTKYNLLIGSAGDLSLNSVAGQDMYFRIGAVIKAAFDSNGFFSIGPDAGLAWTPTSLMHLSSSDDGMIFICHDSAQSPVLAVTGSGKVGINTSNPDKSLHIKETDSAAITLEATDYRKYNIASDGYGFVIHDATTGGTAGYRMVISDQDAALGYVGIGAGASIAGSAHPEALLHLSSSDDGALFRVDTTGGHANSTPVLFATGSKRVGIGTDDPSSRLHVYGNVSSNYLTLIDNDGSSAAHALKVTTDGNGSGTYVLDLEAKSTTLFRVRGDGRVGIGKVTSLPSACLTVSGSSGDGDIAIASKIQHIGDSDTYIEFEDDTITLAAGGRSFIKIEEASQDKLIINHGALDIDFKLGGENNANLIRTCAEFDKVGICYAPDSTDDHELTIIGNVSASLNVSASAFYGDGTGLTGVATAIHDPWVSGSTDTYKRLMTTTGSIEIDGYGFTDGSTVSFDSQFDTDGHAAGALTFNSPVSLSLVVSASAQTGSYDMTISNTDGLSYTVTNGLQVAGTITTNIDGNHKVAANRTNTKYTTVYGVGQRSGFVKTNTGLGWDSGAVTLAEITDGSSGYIEFMPTADQLTGDYYMIGLAYSGSNPAASNNYTQIDYALYCYEGGQTAPYYLVYESGTERSAARAQVDFSEDRLFRVEVIDDTVKYRYSDDHGDSWTDLYTSSVSVDMESNGHLVGMFTFYKTGTPDAASMAAVTCIENIKLNGVLTNYE